MTYFQEVIQASYGGVPYLHVSSSINGGIKSVKKEFPNSNKQLIENLGGKPRIFSITAITTADSSGQNYALRRDRFLNVLESGRRQVLVHPYYGSIDNVICRDFTLIEEDASLGEAKFSILFEVSDTDGKPIVSQNTISVVERSASDSRDQLNNYVSENFGVSKNFPSNFTDAVEKVNDILLAFKRNTTFLQVSKEGVNTFGNKLSSVSRDVNSLVSDPPKLVSELDELFSIVNDLYDNTRSTFEVLEKFFNFGSQDLETPILQNTASRIERSENRNLLNNFVRAQALLLNYTNSTLLEFNNIQQINETESVLENEFQFVSNDAEFDADTIGAINETRVSAREYFEDQRFTTRDIVNVNTKILPARIISYQYYGDSSQGFNIAKLNNDMNVSFIEGDIQILTS